MVLTQPNPRQKRSSVPLWRLAFGWALVCAGIVGIILPVIPGIPALVGGLVILAARYAWAAALLLWVKRRLRSFKARRTAIV